MSPRSGSGHAVVEAEEVRVLGVLVLDDDGDVPQRGRRGAAGARRAPRARGRRTSTSEHARAQPARSPLRPAIESGHGQRSPTPSTSRSGTSSRASQQYIAIAVYYDAETLPQLAAHFYRQAVEERNHAMMMVQYLLDADEDVAIPGVDAPQTDFEDAVAPVSLALAQEKRVTEQIVELVKLAREEGELVGEQFLHWFLQEQREEVASMTELLAVVERGQGQPAAASRST